MSPKEAQKARLYLRSRSLSDRRANGLVYTPKHIVDFVLDAAQYSPVKALEETRLLDPACGAGAFLVAAMDRLAESVRSRGLRLGTAPGSRAFAKLATLALLGIDVDPRACSLARVALRQRFKDLTGRPAPSRIGRCVVKGDFLDLTGRAESAVRQIEPTLVVGNPPYVPTTRLSAARKDYYRRNFKSAHGRIDLYVLFIEQSIRVLRDGGYLTFITPNKYLTSHSARPLRQLMLDSGGIRTIANFSSHRVFEDAATVPCVTMFEKSGVAAEIDSLDCGAKPSPGGKIPILSRRRVPQQELDGQPWHLNEIGLSTLAARMEAAHEPLERFAARISAGIASGLDSVFISARPRNIESALLRPAVRGRDIDAFQVSDPGLTFLVPYRFPREGSPLLIDLEEFPRARTALEPHRAPLSRRHCVRIWKKKWFDLHDPMPLDVARATKILVPDVADRNRFALDSGRFLPLHSAYYIIPRDIDPDFLVALLNSTPSTFLARLRAPIVKDGFSRYRRQVLAALPVPRPGGNLERQIARAGSECDFEGVDALAATAFGITIDELGTMRRFLSRSRAQNRRRGY
jgi:methylase of polypeptide subunit release factors